MNSKREFKVLTDIQHVLLRPGMYLGAVTKTQREQWIFDSTDSKFKFKQVEVVPALLKCASELVDNSIDVAIDTDFKAATKIKVNVDDKSIEVIDDGIGIPCEPPKGNSSKDPSATCACIAWTTLKSGTSFSDNRKKIGTNGVGSSCVAVFSTVFIGESDDGRHRQKIECKNNLSEIKASKVKESSGKSGVRVYCEPDLKRFNIDKIDELHRNLIYQRLVSLSICYPKIKFYFNGEKVNVREKEFASMFSDNSLVAASKNTTIVVFPNDYDEFKQFSCVNGVDTARGGTHVDYVAYEISSRIREKLARKYRSIRPGDVKNKLGLAVLLTDFNDPQFDSQTKESLSNANAEVAKHICEGIDFDDFARKILKNDAIISPIVETFKIKEELKARSELKRIKKVKVRSDKYLSPVGGQKYLFLCEGASAQAALSGCLGRKGFGYYACRGLPINAVAGSIQKIAANQEFKDVMNLLELDITKDAKDKTIAFDRVVIACDQDLDGTHLSSMLVGWFRRFAPNLFNEGKVCKLQTPLVIVKDSKGVIKEFFYSLDEFKAWEEKNPNTKLNIIYQKGLGSMEREDIDWLIAQSNGVDNLMYELRQDGEAFKNVDLWLTGDAAPRKEKLYNYSFDINSI